VCVRAVSPRGHSQPLVTCLVVFGDFSSNKTPKEKKKKLIFGVGEEGVRLVIYFYFLCWGLVCCRLGRFCGGVGGGGRGLYIHTYIHTYIPGPGSGL
jgi:hypothetical protein